jgi:stearoyl-CoA desaturase (delta-9 desaturase)
VGFVLLGFGNTVGYHRLLTHRAFRTAPGVRATFAFLGALHAGPPLLWVGLHRLHHLRSDGPEDPHSPRVRGFWYGHSGWLLGPLGRGRGGAVFAALFAASGFGQQGITLVHDLRRLAGTNPPTWLSLCPDLAGEPGLLLLERPLVTPALFAAQLALAATVGGWAGVAWLWALHLSLTNASWAVNSVCHSPAVGRAPHATGDDSRDVPWLAPSTLGEAYHNTHHRYPRSARHGLAGGFDPSWWLIRGLVTVGLATDPWLPKEARERRA